MPSLICSANASSPKGRAEKAVRAAHLTHHANSCADLPAYCSFRHGLRRATFLREEGFGFPRSLNLSLPPGEMSRSDREGFIFLRKKRPADFSAGLQHMLIPCSENIHCGRSVCCNRHTDRHNAPVHNRLYRASLHKCSRCNCHENIPSES